MHHRSKIALFRIGRVRLAAEEDQVVGQEADRHVGEHHRVRAVGDLLVIHVLVMQVALFAPQALLGCLEIKPALHHEVLVSRIAGGIDVPGAQFGFEHRVAARSGRSVSDGRIGWTVRPWPLGHIS
jgi:hypothetical protein